MPGTAPGAQTARAEDLAEPPAHVVRMALRPAHPLSRQPPERAYALRRRLGVGRVHDLVTAQMQAQGQLPVLGKAAAPAKLAQDLGADHVGGAGDHLQRADELLEWALDHVAARVLGAHRLGEPALAA